MEARIVERIDLVHEFGDGDEEVMESELLVRCRRCRRYCCGWCIEWGHNTSGYGYCYMGVPKAEDED